MSDVTYQKNINIKTVVLGFLMNSLFNIKLQCLAKVFISFKHFHILSCCKRKLKCILLRFYAIDQHKVEHNCVKWKENYVFQA